MGTPHLHDGLEIVRVSVSDEHTTKDKDHEALEGPMTRGRLKQAQHVIETRLVICIAANDDD